jgi:hypothetical protein
MVRKTFGKNNRSSEIAFVLSTESMKLGEQIASGYVGCFVQVEIPQNCKENSPGTGWGKSYCRMSEFFIRQLSPSSTNKLYDA